MRPQVLYAPSKLTYPVSLKKNISIRIYYIFQPLIVRGHSFFFGGVIFPVSKLVQLINEKELFIEYQVETSIIGMFGLVISPYSNIFMGIQGYPPQCQLPNE